MNAGLKSGGRRHAQVTAFSRRRTGRAFGSRETVTASRLHLAALLNGGYTDAPLPQTSASLGGYHAASAPHGSGCRVVAGPRTQARGARTRVGGAACGDGKAETSRRLGQGGPGPGAPA